MSGVAVAATGLVVSVGVLTKSTPVDGAAAAQSASAQTEQTTARGLTQDELTEREQQASRSSDDRRPEADRGKARTLSNAASGRAVTKTQDSTQKYAKPLPGNWDS